MPWCICVQGVFRVAAIGESQAVSGAFNIMTVTLRPNIDIPANSNITIVGLVTSRLCVCVCVCVCFVCAWLTRNAL
jgi:hypothetical protein